MGNANVIAMSILAGGYLSLSEGVAYMNNLSNIAGAVVGVSSVDHAERTFRNLREINS
jgi:hypothetical protein